MLSRRRGALTEPAPHKGLARCAPDAGTLIAGLLSLYPGDEWSLVREVQSQNGVGHEGLRRGDVVAVRLVGHGPLVLRLGEVKRDEHDMAREIRDDAKRAPIAAYCEAVDFIVPAPWKKVLARLGDLPDDVGLVEVAGERASVIVEAPRRRPVEPPPGFLRALLRGSAVRRVEAPHAPATGVIYQRVNRPHLARDRAGLECGHVVRRPPITKERDLYAPIACTACAAGLPTDLEYLEAALTDASREDLDELRARLAARGAA